MTRANDRGLQPRRTDIGASAADGGRLPVGYEVDEVNKPKMTTKRPQGPQRPNRAFPHKDADLDPHRHSGYRASLVLAHLDELPLLAEDVALTFFHRRDGRFGSTLRVVHGEVGEFDLHFELPLLVIAGVASTKLMS